MMTPLATPPLSSSSSSASSPSPSFHSQDDSAQQAPDHLSFDSPDALELLLQTITQGVDSPSAGSPEEWSQMSSWAPQEGKSVEMGSDFNFSFPMDLDFDPNMAVDPSALHFNTSIFTQQPHMPEAAFFQQDYSTNDLNSIFPYDSNTWSQPHNEPGTGRRLSITSSSSSSGASLSPVLEPQSAVSNSPRSDYASSESDAASELAHRVRQAAGVTLAVPVSAQVQQLAAAGGQAKLPIPRLPRLNSQAPILKRANSSKSVSPLPEASPASSPAATPSESSESASQSPESSQPTTTVLGRPKTSHTTIERRYRTNLNARITGLKQAVPALRVLEAKEGHSSFNDVVDSRGFVDGVKVARKMSKANVLGKATEYIRVLKKREARLKREQDGLKSLLSGLVGGPALLKEWEREWRDRFGGDEKDEIEGDDLVAASDDDDEDSEGEDDEGRARKKVRIAKAPKKEKSTKPQPLPTAPTVPGAVPEKRKRGRPRKVPLPPPAVLPPSAVQSPMDAPTAPIVPAQGMQQEYVVPGQSAGQATPQYLLAAFAFFSVWNSPLASSYTRSHAETHAHHGSVLSAHPTMVPTSTASVHTNYNYGVHDMVQAFHLLVSTLVFFYIVFPWLSGALRQNEFTSAVLRRLRTFLTGHDEPSVGADVLAPNKAKAYHRVVLTDALVPSVRGLPDEADRLRKALGVSTGIFGLMQSVIKAARVDRGLELNQLHQRAWTRLGELVACDEIASKATRLQTFWCMSWHVSTFATSTSDLATLAFIILPVSSSKAAELWNRARNQEVLRPYEKIVLANLTVEEAAELLAKWRRWHDRERQGRCAACEKRTPLGVLSAILIRERLRKHAATMFVRTVRPRDAYDECESEEGAEIDVEQEAKERKETVDAGKSIGGRTAQLAVILERIWDTGFCAHEEVIARPAGVAQGPVGDDNGDNEGEMQCEDEHDLASTDEAEIRCLLGATLLYRRIFPNSSLSCAAAVSVILSPPPSPSRKNLALHMSLRAALASAAFDFADERLEDAKLSAALDQARDRVNDLLTAVERSVRRNIRL